MEIVPGIGDEDLSESEDAAVNLILDAGRGGKFGYGESVTIWISSCNPLARFSRCLCDLAKGGDSISDAHCDPAGIGDNDLLESEDDAATLNLDAVQIWLSSFLLEFT